MFLYLSINLNMCYMSTYVWLSSGIFVCVSLYIYQFKHVLVSTDFLDDFRNVCLCFLIYQSKHVFCGYQCFGGVQECLFVLFIFLLV